MLSSAPRSQDRGAVSYFRSYAVKIYRVCAPHKHIEIAQSRADFIKKLEVALKEAGETEYWLEIIFRKKKITDDAHKNLKTQCGTIKMLIASVTTAKNNITTENEF